MVTRTQIVELLKTNDKAIARALVVLNERQTVDERSAEGTHYNNGKGFTPADARMGTNMAQFYIKYNRLSEKQLAYWRKPNVRGVPRICKYAGQLVEIANAKAAVQTSNYIGADIGNLMEEKMVLEEMYDNAGMRDDEAEAERIGMRLIQINEALEEIKLGINKLHA